MKYICYARGKYYNKLHIRKTIIQDNRLQKILGFQAQALGSYITLIYYMFNIVNALYCMKQATVDLGERTPTMMCSDENETSILNSTYKH